MFAPAQAGGSRRRMAIAWILGMSTAKLSTTCFCGSSILSPVHEGKCAGRNRSRPLPPSSMKALNTRIAACHLLRRHCSKFALHPPSDAAKMSNRGSLMTQTGFCCKMHRQLRVPVPDIPHPHPPRAIVSSKKLKLATSLRRARYQSQRTIISHGMCSLRTRVLPALECGRM